MPGTHIVHFPEYSYCLIDVLPVGFYEIEAGLIWIDVGDEKFSVNDRIF